MRDHVRTTQGKITVEKFSSFAENGKIKNSDIPPIIPFDIHQRAIRQTTSDRCYSGISTLTLTNLNVAYHTCIILA